MNFKNIKVYYVNICFKAVVRKYDDCFFCVDDVKNNIVNVH